MKYNYYLSLLLVFLFLSCSGTRTTTNISKTFKEFHNASSHTVLVAAHRGAHMGTFENSIASTKKAIKLGVDIIEADVRTTKDGYLVLMHDATIDRTTTGKGKVEDLTLAELKSVRLKAPYGRISKESAPTFEEFLNLIKGKIMVDIDIKTDNVKGIVAIIKKTGTSKNVFYFDNDYDQLDVIRKLDNSAQIMPRAYSYKMTDSALVRFSPAIVHIDPSFYNSELTKLLKKNNARIWINTLGEADSHIRYGQGEMALKKVLKYGANAIQTDEPEMLLQLLRHMGLHD